ncbi:Oidioi.mRNA.OKI2018_I69.chr1.g178.t1.cds [Oikopleura dioica]|uniref:Oidioi.mRNA.OKI2018_I69.chr1.g178.t1.cds n=1 Tax=Oikopleura dioica TaxID=34765 RepID=A0ABN7SP87_OIKDI|nr:Oidioi.mRNA.OKI2018_I69.chr1.g178.t1.cds [Oikopleura dioica]
MARDYAEEDYYGPAKGLICWDCVPKTSRGDADNLAYAHVIWKFFHENFPGARISQDGRISVNDVDKILQGKLFHKKKLFLSRISAPEGFQQNIEESEDESLDPVFDEKALEIGKKEFAKLKASADFEEMIQDGEIDYYEARRLVYCLSLRLNEANIKTDIKGTVYPRVGTTQEKTGLYHDWTNFIYRKNRFYKDYWNIAAASGSGITKAHISNWYPKLKRELEKGNQSTLAKSASEYVNEVFRRYNIDQEEEEGSQHGYLSKDATLNFNEAREWLYVFADYIYLMEERGEIEQEMESMALPPSDDETAAESDYATEASEIPEISQWESTKVETTVVEKKNVAFEEPLEEYFNHDIKILNRLIDQLDLNVIQTWKRALASVQQLRCNNRIFAVRGEMYSLFGYTVLNKLMIMKSYWLGQMFTNLKILDEHLEALETYLEFLRSKIAQLNDDEFQQNLKTNQKMAKEDMARQELHDDHCKDFWKDTNEERQTGSKFYDDEEVILNGDISFGIDEIIKNDSEKVHELMAKIVIFMKKLVLPKTKLPIAKKSTKFENFYQFKTVFGESLAINLTYLRDICFQDINTRIESMKIYSSRKTSQLVKFQKTFNSMSTKFEEYEITCLHNERGHEIGIKHTPALPELDLLDSSSFLMNHDFSNRRF